MFEQYKPLLSDIQKSLFSQQLREIRAQVLTVIRRRYHLSQDLVQAAITQGIHYPQAIPNSPVDDEIQDEQVVVLDEQIDDSEGVTEDDYKTKLKKLILPYLEPITFSDAVIDYFLSERTEGVPFTDLDTNPRQISQLKKIINALYYAEIAFVEIEKLNLDSLLHTRANGLAIYHAMKNVNQALSLLTHIDVSVQYLLKPQIKALTPIVTFARGVLSNDLGIDKIPLPDISKSTKRDQTVPLAKYTGQVAGTVIKQMKPDDDDAIDYSLITHFATDLPEYISVVSKYIDDLTDKTIAWDAQLNEERIRALQQVAKKLLTSIASVQARALLDPRNVKPYIKIISQIIKISTEILEEVNGLNGNTQNTLKIKLKELKYSLLPQCVGLVDNIEASLMLNPGTFSKSTLHQFDSLYKKLLGYAKAAVDVESDHLGRELKCLVDDEFTEKRVASIEWRIFSCEKNKWLLSHARTSWLAFKKVIEDYPTTHIAELPQDIKSNMRRLYQSFQPYLALINPEMDSEIVGYLKQLPVHADYSVWAYAKSPFVRLKNTITTKSTYFDTNSRVLGLDDKLMRSFEKEDNTYDFFKRLNQDILQTMSHQREAFTNVTTVLMPQTPDSALIEMPMFSGDSQSENTLKQSIECLHKSEKLKVANRAFDGFWHILGELKERNIALEKADEGHKEKLRRHYKVFRPYMLFFMEDKIESNRLLVEGIEASEIEGEEQERVKASFLAERKRDAINSALVFDTIVCNHLNVPLPGQSGFSPSIHWDQWDRVKSRMKEGLDKYKTEFHGGSTFLKTKAKREKAREDIQKPLTVFTKKHRRHALIKSEEGSKKVAQCRKSLMSYISHFDKVFLDCFTPESIGLPFPEIEKKEQEIFVPEQVKAIKKIFNGLFYAEEVFKKLEGMKDVVIDYQASSSLSSFIYSRKDYLYVTHMLSLLNSAKQAFDLLYYAKDDLFVQTLINNVRLELTKRQKDFLVLQAELEGEPTIINEAELGDVSQNIAPVVMNQDVVKDSHLSNTLALFYMLPNKLYVFDNQRIDPEKQSILRKKGKARAKIIETIIEGAGSWLSIMANVPSIVASLTALKKRLELITEAGYQVTHHQLKEIKTTYFAKLLVASDDIERTFALKQGVLSKPLQLILLQFYEGLVEQLDIGPDLSITLITESSFMQQRFSSNQIKHDELNHDLDEIKPIIHQAKVLLSDFSTYEVESKRYIPNQNVLASLRYHLSDYYMILQPLLQTKDESFTEDFLRAENATYSRLTTVATAVKSILDTSIQKASTLSLSVGLCESKDEFLINEKRKLIVNNIQFTRKHIENRIHDVLHTNICKQLKLVHFKEDYIKRIHQSASAKIKDLSLNIIHQQRRPGALEPIIFTEINAFINTFNEENLDAYHTLEKGYNAYLEFYTFLDSDIFTEHCTDRVISRKKDAIAPFRIALLDDTRSPTERVSNAYETVTSYQFRRNMHSSFSYSWSSLRWLTIWIDRLKAIFMGNKPIEDRYLSDNISFFKPTTQTDTGNVPANVPPDNIPADNIPMGELNLI